MSGGYDGKIVLWNTEERSGVVAPTQEYFGHKSAVEDVCWHRFHQEIFGSCGDDRSVIM